MLASAARTNGPAGTFYDPLLADATATSDAGQIVSSVLVLGPSAQGMTSSSAGPLVGLPAGSGRLPLESLPTFGSEPVDPTPHTAARRRWPPPWRPRCRGP